jgi:hypothetical protein
VNNDTLDTLYRRTDAVLKMLRVGETIRQNGG